MVVTWGGDLNDEKMTALSRLGNDYRPTSAYERGKHYVYRLENEFGGKYFPQVFLVLHEYCSGYLNQLLHFLFTLVNSLFGPVNLYIRHLLEKMNN